MVRRTSRILMLIWLFWLALFTTAAIMADGLSGQSVRTLLNNPVVLALAGLPPILAGVVLIFEARRLSSLRPQPPHGSRPPTAVQPPEAQSKE